MFIKCRVFPFYLLILYIFKPESGNIFKIYFLLCWIFIAVQAFSSCGKWGYSLVVCKLLVAMPSLVGEHRF